MLSYAAKTDIGNQRANNEDCYLADPGLNLWVMADGVGGQDAGEVASQIVCNVIQSEVQLGHGLEDAINMAHQTVKASPSDGVGTPGMASTVVVLLVHGSEFQVSWVGDSRAYLWSDGQLAQLTHDQSLVQRLLDENVITEEQAKNHPRRNLVIQAIGQPNLETVEVETSRGPFKEDDIILLCSDGLSDYVTDDEIKALVQAADNETVLVDQLVSAALATEGKDNITVLAVNMQAKKVQKTLQMKAINAGDGSAPEVIAAQSADQGVLEPTAENQSTKQSAKWLWTVLVVGLLLLLLLGSGVL
jgi:protein phosphatase